MDLSKKLEEELIRKRLESPLDLSQKTIVTNDQEDKKPHRLFDRTPLYLSQTSVSSVPTAQSKQQHVQRTLFDPVLSAFAAYIPSPVSTALVQKVSPVRPQTYSCTAEKQINSRTKTCVIAASQQFKECRTSDNTDQVSAVHSRTRNISVVKPSASTVSVEPTKTDSCSLPALLPSQHIQRNQNISPLYSTATFDTARTDRGLPLAQVYPSRVVTSSAQNTTKKTVPSPVYCSDEVLRTLPSNNVPLVDKACPTVFVANTSKMSSLSESIAAVPALTSDDYSAVKSPVYVSTKSTEVSPQTPILSPNVPSSASHASPSAMLSAELFSAKFNYGKGILPSVDSSPKSLSDHESIPDEDSSGHELTTSCLEWDANVPDGKDFFSDICHVEEQSVKRPAFEVVGDCNRTLLSDISRPCYAAVAFDRSLLQNESDHRDFIARTKYCRFSRKAYAGGSGAGSGAYDLDVIQLDKCSSPNVSSSTSQELRLPLQLSSTLKNLQTSKSKLNASRAVSAAAFPQKTSPSGGKDLVDDVPRRYNSLSSELNCEHGVLDKKVKKLHHQKLIDTDSVKCDVNDSIYSPKSNSRPKRSIRGVYSNSVVQVKSEPVEASAECLPGRSIRNLFIRRKKNIPGQTSTSNFNTFYEIVGNIYEVNNSNTDLDRVSHNSARSHESSESSNVKQEQLTESADINDSENVGRKNPHGDARGVRQRKTGNANKNQGKIDALAVSTATSVAASVSEPKHLNDVHQVIKTSTTESMSADDLHHSKRVTQSTKVSVHTRSSTASGRSDKSDITPSYSYSKRMSSVSKPRQTDSENKLTESSRTTASASAQLSSRSNRTVSKRTVNASDMNRKKFGPFRRLNRYDKDRSVTRSNIAAKASKSDSSTVASDVSVAQSKGPSSILKQLESSEGYIAEKNAKYSKSEDLFDDSSLLSREQRALRVSNVSSLKIFTVSVIAKDLVLMNRTRLYCKK